MSSFNPPHSASRNNIGTHSTGLSSDPLPKVAHFFGFNTDPPPLNQPNTSKPKFPVNGWPETTQSIQDLLSLLDRSLFKPPKRHTRGGRPSPCPSAASSCDATRYVLCSKKHSTCLKLTPRTGGLKPRFSRLNRVVQKDHQHAIELAFESPLKCKLLSSLEDPLVLEDLLLIHNY